MTTEEMYEEAVKCAQRATNAYFPDYADRQIALGRLWLELSLVDFVEEDEMPYEDMAAHTMSAADRTPDPVAISLDAAAKEQEAKWEADGWYKWPEKFPPFFKRVLVTFGPSFLPEPHAIAVLCGQDFNGDYVWREDHTAGKQIHAVSHWRFLPNPPIGGAI